VEAGTAIANRPAGALPTSPRDAEPIPTTRLQPRSGSLVRPFEYGRLSRNGSGQSVVGTRGATRSGAHPSGKEVGQPSASVADGTAASGVIRSCGRGRRDGTDRHSAASGGRRAERER
jgi:hypothetical protein